MSEAKSEPGRRVLIAEDDRSMRELMARIVSEAGHEVEAVPDGLTAMARLAEPFDLVITDLRMPGADGIEVLKFVRNRWPATPVVVVTAFGSIPGAVDAMRLGALDYLSKPLPDPEALRQVVARGLAAGPGPSAIQPVAVDPASKALLDIARKVAQSEATVLLLGGSGTGKEVVARFVHDVSGRHEGPFVAINCAALPEGLLESELFGHEKGAFTDARERHHGRFEQADGGTLFLDEIGETSLAVQAKLLRVLQERTVQRLGAEQPIDVDVRLLAATNKDLEQAVADGGFREDLYYRLAVFPIRIPPLRERPGDILPLAQHFLKLLARGPERTVAPITPEAREALLAHSWPGNVRELQNVIERAVILSGGGPLGADVLGLGGAATFPSGGSADAATDPNPTAGTLKDMERRAIETALAAEGGNRRRTAKRLGIALRTLQYKLKEYGLG